MIKIIKNKRGGYKIISTGDLHLTMGSIWLENIDLNHSDFHGFKYLLDCGKWKFGVLLRVIKWLYYNK